MNLLFTIACPDGELWGDEFHSATSALAEAIKGDRECGCGEAGHLVMQRPESPWTPLAPLPDENGPS